MDPLPKRSIYAYTDGCNSGKVDNNARVGSGVWLSEKPSTRIPVHTMSFATENDGTNNIAGEVRAALAALKWAWDNGYDIVVLVTDLEGITNWGDGRWKRNKPITVELYNTVKAYRETGKLDIRFVWTKGHQTKGRHAYGNSQADMLAAQSLEKKG